MKKSNLIFLLMALSILLLSACTQSVQVQKEEKIAMQEEGKSSIIGNKAILNEISRLSKLAASNAITEKEIESLETMIESDEDAKDELHEIETFVKHKEYIHAVHGLSFLDAYVRTGKHLLCPSHALAHYYVFGRNGEQELAEEALEEAKEQLPEWKPLAKEYDEKYPGQVRFDVILKTIETHLKSIESDKTSATDKEINFLANEGSLCVESDEEE